MNSRDEVMSRLLDMFPKQSIRQYFRVRKRTKEDILTEIVRQATDAEISEYTRVNLGYAKQHVYIMNHNIPDIGNLPDRMLTPNTMKTRGSGIIEYFDLLDVAYQVYLQDPAEIVSLKYKCPIKTKISEALATIHFAIIEKNIQSHFDSRDVATHKKTTEENTVISLIVNQLSGFGTLEICDLNKGVKELWELDIVDVTCPQ